MGSPPAPFGWIYNPAVLNIRIFNPDLAPFIALQMLIFNAVGLQIRLNGFVSVLLLQSLEASPTTMRQIRKPSPIEGLIGKMLAPVAPVAPSWVQEVREVSGVFLFRLPIRARKPATTVAPHYRHDK